MSELFSLCIERLHNCYSVSPSIYLFDLEWTFREHLCHALPTEKIFYLLRSIRSECLIRDYSVELVLDMLEVIIEWLQVSCWWISTTDKSLKTKKFQFMCLGTWIRAPERLVRSFPGWTSSTPKNLPLYWLWRLRFTSRPLVISNISPCNQCKL